MQNCVGPLFIGGNRDPAAENQVFKERNASGVFHCAGIELRHEKLIVFGKWVTHLELIFKESETLLGDFKYFIRV